MISVEIGNPCQTFPMRRLTAILCLTIAVLLGSAACALNGEQGPVTASDTVFEKSDSGLEVSFTQMQVTLRSEPGLRSPVKKVLKQAISKKALLLKQNKTWIQIRFEGEDFWVYALFLDRNLTPAVMEVLFKASDVNLRSGPGTRFPILKVLKNANFKRAVPFGKFEDWVHIVFDKHPYWVHSSLILQRESSAISSKSADQGANQLSYFAEQKMKAAAGDPKAMEMVSGIYEHNENLHLEMSYMWLSLAVENAALDDKRRIQNYLEEYIIPKLRDSDIAGAEKRMKRCKESKYRDCGETSMRVFHGK